MIFLTNFFKSKYFLDTYDLSANDRGQIFSLSQILLCLAIFTFFILLLIILSKCSKLTQKRALYISSAVLLILEIFRYCYLGFIRYGYFSKDIFGFNLSNMLAIFIPLNVLIFKKRSFYSASFLYGIVAGMVVMIYPRDVIAGYYLFHILVIQSLISHMLFVFIGLLLVISGTYKPNLKKDFLGCISTFIAFTIIAKIMVYVYNNEENFFFMREFDFASLNNIPFYIYYPIIIILVSLLTALCLYLSEKLVNKLNK
jgi:hypothetical protein